MSAPWIERTAPSASILVSSGRRAHRDALDAMRAVEELAHEGERGGRQHNGEDDQRGDHRRLKLLVQRRAHGVVEAQRRVVEAGGRRLAHDGLGAQPLDQRLERGSAALASPARPNRTTAAA